MGLHVKILDIKRDITGHTQNMRPVSFFSSSNQISQLYYETVTSNCLREVILGKCSFAACFPPLLIYGNGPNHHGT